MASPRPTNQFWMPNKKKNWKPRERTQIEREKVEKYGKIPASPTFSVRLNEGYKEKSTFKPMSSLKTSTDLQKSKVSSPPLDSQIATLKQEEAVKEAPSTIVEKKKQD